MMERKTSAAWCRSAGRALQWGRSDDGAENVRSPAPRRGAEISFNGAAPMMERKTHAAERAITSAETASMGPLR